MTYLPTILRDLAILLGAGCLIAGCWYAWPPLGLIVLGGALAAFGVLSQMDCDRKRAEEEYRRSRGL